jgi:hypothetical protein
MIVYHGSNMIVEKPRLVHQNRTLDFGYGFYTTTNQNQAQNFAAKVTDRREIGSPCVSMYEIVDLEELTKRYKILTFSGADEAWLDFVFANRNGSYTGAHYDIILGPVANDTIYRTFVAYEEGILTKEETIARLKVKKLYDQMTFTTEAALAELRYIGQLDEGRKSNE